MRGRKLIHSPDSAWVAFVGGFAKVAIGVGIPMAIYLLVMVRSWSDLGPMAAIVLGFAGGGGVIAGLVCAAPVLLQNWAWRTIAEDTPVADHDEGLGS